MNLHESINTVADQWLLLVGYAAWQAAIVGIVILLVTQFGRRVSSPMRYGILLLAFAKFVVPPLATTPTGVFGLVSVSNVSTDLEQAVLHADVERTGEAVDHSMTRSSVPQRSPGPVDRFQVSDVSVSSNRPTETGTTRGGPGMMDLIGEAPAHSSKHRVVSSEFNNAEAAIRHADVPASRVQSPATSLTWSGILMIVHLIGTLVCLVAIAGRVFTLHRSVGKMESATESLMAQFRQCADHLALRRVPSLRVSREATVPFSFGILRPTVVVANEQVRELSAAEMRTVLLHELAHHRRYDLWIVTVQALVSAFWWFHPVVWFINRAIRVVREDCCDDLLLQRGHVTSDGYCATLLRVARMQTPRAVPAMAVTMAGPGQSLSHRFRRIMDDRLKRRDRTTWLAAIGLLIAGLVILPGMSRSSTAIPAATGSVATEVEGSGVKSALGSTADSPREASADPVSAAAHVPMTDEGSSDQNATTARIEKRSQAPKAKAWPEFLNFRVLDPQGEPINKALVKRKIDDEIVEFFTDADGRTKIPTTDKAADSTTFTVSADVEPFVVFYTWWRFGKAPLHSEYVFRLEDGQTVGGKVVDSSGVPISGAKVLVKFSPNNDGRSWPRPGYPRFAITTNDAGEWEQGRIPTRLSSIQLRVASEHYISDAEPISATKALEKLQARTHTRTMRKGISLRGQVVGGNGEPISGVKVRLADDAFPDHIDMPVTDATGSFEFRHCASMQTILLAYKAGLAPFTKPIRIEGNDQFVKCTMKPGRTVTVRVTDKAGQPVEGAQMYVHEAGDWPTENAGAYGELHLGFEEQVPRTNSQGIWTWSSAPTAPFTVQPIKRASQNVPRRTVEEGTKELAFKLNPELVIVGRVIDGESGEPIDRFDVTQGGVWEFERGDSKTLASLSWDGHSTSQGTKGRFTKRLSATRVWHKVRIEADGYLPLESRRIESDEGRISLDFRMKRPEGQMTLAVVSADGEPEANASVIVATKESRAYIRANLQSSNGRGKTFKTDKAGRLNLRPQTGPFTAYIVGSSGFAMIDQDAFDRSKGVVEVCTKPWGRVEGVARRDGKVLADYPVSLNFTRGRSWWGPFAHFDFDVDTDDQGRFVFDRVPAETPITVAQVKRIKHGRMTVQKWQARAKLELKAGQTQTLKLGGNGVTVTGRFKYEGDNADLDWTESRVYLSAKDEKSMGRNGVLYLPAQEPTIQHDGTFQWTEVLPGEYKLTAHIYKKGTVPSPGEIPQRGKQTYISLGQRFHVFEVGASQADLGELPIFPSGRSQQRAAASTPKMATQLPSKTASSFRLQREVRNQFKQPVAAAEATIWYVNDGPALRHRAITSKDGRLEVDSLPTHGAWLFIKADGYRMHGEYIDGKSSRLPIQLVATHAKVKSQANRWPSVDHTITDRLQKGLMDFATASKVSLDQHFQFELERFLAQYAPDFALKHHESQTIDFSGFNDDPQHFAAWHDSVVRSFIAQSIVTEDADRAESLIQSIPDPVNRFWVYTRAAIKQHETDPGRSLTWMEKAFECAQTPGDGKSLTRAWRLNHVAENYEKLGEPQLAGNVLQLAVSEVQKKSNHELADSSRMSVAVQLAPTDLKTALSLLPPVNPEHWSKSKIEALVERSERDEADSKSLMKAILAANSYGKVAERLAAHNPAEAERLLSLLGDMKDRSAIPVCFNMATVDFARARRIADTMTADLNRGHALGVMAHALAGQPVARQLLEESFELLEKSAGTENNEGPTALKVGLSLLPTAERIAPGLVREYLWRTLSFRRGTTVGGTCGRYGCPPVKPLGMASPTDGSRVLADPVAAALVSRFDLDAARKLAFAPGDTTLNNPFSDAPFFLLGALATIDAEAAANAVLKMPHKTDHQRRTKLKAFEQVLPVLAQKGEERWNALVDETLGVWRVGKDR